MRGLGKAGQGRARILEGRPKLETEAAADSRLSEDGQHHRHLNLTGSDPVLCSEDTEQTRDPANESIHLPTGLQLSWHAPAVRPFNSATVYACVCTAALRLQTPPRKNNQTAL